VHFLNPVYNYSALWTEVASFCDISTMIYQTTRCQKAENPSATVAGSKNPQSQTIL